jgi:hypothetical protein
MRESIITTTEKIAQEYGIRITEACTFLKVMERIGAAKQVGKITTKGRAKNVWELPKDLNMSFEVRTRIQNSNIRIVK